MAVGGVASCCWLCCCVGVVPPGVAGALDLTGASAAAMQASYSYSWLCLAAAWAAPTGQAAAAGPGCWLLHWRRPWLLPASHWPPLHGKQMAAATSTLPAMMRCAGCVASGSANTRRQDGRMADERPMMLALLLLARACSSWLLSWLLLRREGEARASIGRGAKVNFHLRKVSLGLLVG
eukprot:COSAG01_NODE_13671_length_1550_cov_10.459683_1_plen_179_part_00